VSPDATTRLWYPARRGTGTGDVPYVTEAVAASQGTTIEQLHDVRVRARENAEPLPGAPRPAVVLMPGWASAMAVSTSLAQDLASNGYVVVAVDPALGTEDAATLPNDIANPARRLDQVAAALAYVVGPHIAALAGPVDPTRVAIGGHSIAGAVGYQVSLTDRRVHAVFDLDGRLPANVARATAVPVLVIDASGIGAASAALIARTPHAVTVRLEGATHFDVTDLPCLAQAFGPDGTSALGLGSIGRSGTTTTDAVVRRFLDAVLRNGRAVPTVMMLTAGLEGAVRDR
jgi:dienelactone hydrolase